MFGEMTWANIDPGSEYDEFVPRWKEQAWVAVCLGDITWEEWEVARDA